MQFIDTHIHLQDLKSGFAPADFAPLGIMRCICVSTGPEDWEAVALLAERFPDFVVPAFGLHPWQAAAAKADWPARLENFLRCFSRALIGECGLDRLKNPEQEKQKEAFALQIALAEKYRRPLLIHAVKAQDWLEGFWSKLPPKFVFHSYAGRPELLKKILSAGGFVSFSPSIRKIKNPQETVKAVPAERLLLESDAPYQGRPEDLRALLGFLAQCRGEDEEALAAQIYKNGKELCGGD